MFSCGDNERCGKPVKKLYSVSLKSAVKGRRLFSFIQINLDISERDLTNIITQLSIFLCNLEIHWFR